MNQKEISDFYNEFASHQLKIGVNERLVSLYRRLLKLGLKSSSTVLELGCGIGNFTRLLGRTVKSGSIEAVDLSDKSIQIAQKSLANKQNIIFKAADIIHYKPQTGNADFVSLMDVIEHIPVSEHAALFKNISSYAAENTLICINIPNPDYIEFTRTHHPQMLQVIDQPIRLPNLIGSLEEAGLEIIYFEKYSIWEEEDYHFLVLRKKRAFRLTHLADKRTILQKIQHKIVGKINSLKYR